MRRQIRNGLLANLEISRACCSCFLVTHYELDWQINIRVREIKARVVNQSRRRIYLICRPIEQSVFSKVSECAKKCPPNTPQMIQFRIDSFPFNPISLWVHTGKKAQCSYLVSTLARAGLAP